MYPNSIHFGPYSPPYICSLGPKCMLFGYMAWLEGWLTSHGVSITGAWMLHFREQNKSTGAGAPNPKFNRGLRRIFKLPKIEAINVLDVL